MPTFHLEYLLYFFLAGICMTLAFNSHSIKYIASTSDEKFLILDTNIEYLSQLTLRLDRMLEIIYFSFMAALFYLGFCYGHMQRKVRELEGKVEEWSRAVKGLGGGQIHPAYVDTSFSATDVVGLKSVMQENVRDDEDRRLNAQIEIQRRKDMEIRAGTVAIEEDPRKKMAPPAYRKYDTDLQVKVCGPGSA
jgi:hypothetical protein